MERYSEDGETDEFGTFKTWKEFLMYRLLKIFLLVFSLFVRQGFAFCDETEVLKKEEKLPEEAAALEEKAAKAEAAPSKTEKPQTTITCKGHLDMSYGKNMAIFNDDVVVNDPRMKMKADKMKVFFESESRAIQKVIATGHVRFKKEDKSAKSRKAVYTAKDGKVVLTGKPMVKKGDSIMTGEMITFFRDDSRMLIEPTAKLIFYTEDQEEFKEGWMK